MKLTVNDEAELSSLEQLSDEEILGRVRDGITRLRAARDANPGNVASSKEIELSDHTADDPGPFPGKPAAPDRPGASAAALDAAIPGYSRLSPAGRDRRVVDEDRIVVTPRRSWQR